MNLLMVAIMLGMGLLALLLVLVPLLRKGRAAKQLSHRQAQLEIYAGRVKELDQELTNGELSRTEYDAALADLDREVAESGGLAVEKLVDNLTEEKTPWVAIAVSLFLPVVAFGIYYSVVGSPSSINPEQFEQAINSNNSTHQTAMEAEDETEQFYMLAEQLQQRLAVQPEDADSWVLLARTLVYLRHFTEAVDAYEMAIQHGANDDPRMLASYADVLAQVQGDLAGRPVELIMMALEIDPNHGQSLWLAGTAAFQQADYDAAEGYWEHLIKVLPADSEDVLILRRNLVEVATRKQAAAKQ